MKQQIKHIALTSITTIVICFVLWMLISLGGCASFEKTTGYKKNTYWHNEK